MKYQIIAPIERLKGMAGCSERSLARAAGISRGCLRQILSRSKDFRISSLLSLSEVFERKIQVLMIPNQVLAECSSIAVALKVESGGFESWKVHFMDLVDEFRRTLDPRLILLPPHSSLDIRLQALLASIVSALCQELNMEIPDWAERRCYLHSPWFVSEMESLKACALSESPLAFRRNNIFVQDNFLSRV